VQPLHVTVIRALADRRAAGGVVVTFDHRPAWSYRLNADFEDYAHPINEHHERRASRTTMREL